MRKVKASDNFQRIFKEQGFCIIPGVIPLDIVDFLSEYALLKHSVKPNVYRNADDSLADIHREYADPAMEVLLARLHSAAESVAGASLWPTLSFYYTYRGGNVLRPHKDRASCEIVACACLGLDSDYQRDQGTWPIYVENLQGKAVAVHLNPGDVVFFQGARLEHWREIFSGEWCVSAIFAYVYKEGNNAFLRYDQRKGLGYKHVGMLRWLTRFSWYRLRSALGF